MNESFTFEQAEAHMVKAFEAYHCHFPHRTEQGARSTNHGQILTFELYSSEGHFKQAQSRPLYSEELDRALFSDPGRLGTYTPRMRT